MPASGERAVRPGGAPTPSSIVILGGDADGNLGDRAILRAMCLSLRELLPATRLVVVTAEPAAAGARYGAEAIRRGPRGLPALCRAMSQSRLVLIGGGGLFQDDDSLVKMPYWAARTALARLLCRRVVGYALGVGPLRAPMSRWLARGAFACMGRVSVRDETARRLATELAPRASVELVPDPAIALPTADARVARELLAAAGAPLDGRPLVGVALRRWFPPQARLIPHKLARRLGLPDPQDGPEGERLETLLAASLDRLVLQHRAFVLLMPSYGVTHEGDERLCEAVRRRMRSPAATLLRLDDPALYKACTGLLTAMLGGRMHPLIFAAAMGTPVVGLAYNPKFTGFLTLLGEPESCIEVVELVRSGDTRPLDQLLDRAMTIGRRPLDQMHELQARVRRFDREIAAMVG
jgi:polysaccharide pyruvyl transferase WcaK-like protein